MNMPNASEQVAFEHHVQRHIAHDLAAQPLISARRKRLKDRIMGALVAKPDSLILQSNADFISIFPGVSVRKLQDQGGSMMAVWKLARGARIPKHGHISDEACFVLDGQLEHAGRLLQKGDFLCAAAGEDQLPILALWPSLLLIRGESRF